MPDAKLTEIAKFFGMTIREFRDEWAALGEIDKAQLRQGIGNETFTY